MTRNKQYRGSSRKNHGRHLSDAELVEERTNQKKREHTRNISDQHLFETKMGIKDPQIRFDYTDNVFSLRGNWSTSIKVVKLYFPFIVRKEKCKQFEELVGKAFETIFLA